MKCKHLIIVATASFLSACCPSHESILVVDDVFTPLPAGAIHLKGGLEVDVRNSLDHWNKGVVPYDSLVEFFRQGHDYFALGEMWGKAVRSGCMFYRYTQDQELKDILKKTVADLLTTERSNGSISCVPVEEQPGDKKGDLWERKYVMLALEEYYEHVEADSAVLGSLKRQADCILSQIGPAPKREITDLGWSDNHIESSTLLEPIMRLYKWTGEGRYLDFAHYIVESGGSLGYNLFQQTLDDVPPYQMGGTYPKAYEMLSLFEGLVEYYRCTGEERWRQAALKLYQAVCRYELTIIGNGGGDQPYHPKVLGEAWDHTAVEQTNPNMSRMMETCVGVTWMKYCSQLLRLTGDVSTVDCIETYLYNGLLGAMKPTGDGFSYVNLLNGAKVTNEGWGKEIGGLPVTCCNLNGPMGLAYIPYIAVMESQRGPVIQLYNSASVRTATPAGHPLQMEIETDFPRSPQVVVTVMPQKAEEFTVSLRNPRWSERTIVKVNGEPVPASAPGSYITLQRLWSPGDRIELTMDMRAHLLDAPEGSNPAGRYFQAVTYGPIVLARDERTDESYNRPVQIVTDSCGQIAVSQVTPRLPSSRLEFEVPTTEGTIRMTDYASIDCWQGSKICTWLPKK